MDYKTRSTSRINLRRYSNIFRELFDVPPTGPFPVLEALEKLPDVFENCGYCVVEDEEFPSTTMARCYQNSESGFTIEIRASVYQAAYEDKIGACLGFICHEICHVFLFLIGFVPIFERSFQDKELPPYCSVEWQAKALCGEVMIPYEESIGMTKKEMMSLYHVSEGFAKTRRSLDKEKCTAVKNH